MVSDLEKLSVLIVAESPQLRRLVISALQAHRIKIVLECGTGQEGFLMFCDKSPNLVLADWETGTMSGIELTRKIRSDAASPDRKVPIILMLANNTGIEHIADARNAGVTGLLLKPFSAGDLIKHIHYAIDDRREFIETPGYTGPDRRTKPLPDYAGPMRRAADAVDKESVK
ncbi:MAG TPA: response regulator [Patescibacteria group bacterium]|nr:response regulator [Patescibacteria group bacterium]